DIERVTRGWEMFGNGAGRRHLIRLWNIERFAVRHDTAAFVQTKLPIIQSFRIDAQFHYTPVGVMRGGEPKLDVVLVKLILRLEMLGRQEHPLRPDNPVPVLHSPLDLLAVAS